MKTRYSTIYSINNVLKKPYRIILFISFISAIAGMSVDLIDYVKQASVFLIFLNSLSLLLYIVFFVGFLFEKFDIRFSAAMLIYIMITNILATNIYALIYEIPDWQFSFLRGTLIIAVFVTISGLILKNIHVIIINILYVATLITIWILSEPNFITNNILFFALILAAYSYAIYMFMNKLKYSLQQNQQLQQELFTREQEILDKDNELIRERALRLQESLDIKNKELLSSALVLTQHLESRKRIINRLEKLSNNPTTDIGKEILDILSEVSSSDNVVNWSEFQKRFEDVHQDFYTNLGREFPKLSPAELKLAAFIKLGLSTKDICALSNNTRSSVEVARSRLRKKINLQPTDNLVLVLSKF